MADRFQTTSEIQNPEKSRSYAYSRTKRAFDLVLSILLLVFLSPVLIIGIVVNAFFTGGHPIFVQCRAGENGVRFSLIKLRTMRLRSDGEDWPYRTASDDDRLTAIGKCMRRTYIDELPQLINVVAGHMSIVGPRPETLEIAENIAKDHPRFDQRVAVKPGITGIAQVYFRKPESDQDLWRRYYYDRFYILRSSLKLDVILTVMTLMHVLRNRGS